MKRLRKLICSKLKSQSGESLSEVLIAVLVSTLGLTLLAGMITSSVKIIQSSKKNFNVYMDEENKLVEQLEGLEGNIYIEGLVLSDEFKKDNDSQIPVYYFTNILVAEDASNAKIIYTYKAK